MVDAEKKYHCQWPNCQRRFCSEETLNLHYRKHTGEKPFNCALCLFNCYDKPSLNEHYQQHHAKDTNLEGPPPYRTFHQLSTSSSSQQNPNEIYGFRGSFDARTLTTRTSTPVPVLRHRMADILDSCGSQVPGPLDAEINGILDSLDKESDLPDLFSTGNFEFDGANAENRFPPSNNQGFNSQISPYRSHVTSSTITPSQLNGPAGNPEPDSTDPALGSVLPNLLSDLQRAELSGSTEEFETAKMRALSVLPTFASGEKLSEQIGAIADEVLQRLIDQPVHVLRAAFQATRPFTRDETYMVDLLEQQLLSETPLIAPNPPRRRGRRPKMQQQLQPYLQRIFSLESGAAEAMAAQFVNAAQKDRCVSYYGYYRSAGFGRGRGCRGRGRSGRPLSLTLKLLPDGTAARTSQCNQSLCRPGGFGSRLGHTARKLRGGIRGRYRIEQMSDEILPNFPRHDPMQPYSTNSEMTTNMNPGPDPHCMMGPHPTSELYDAERKYRNPNEAENPNRLQHVSQKYSDASEEEEDEEMDDVEGSDDGGDTGDGEFDVENAKPSVVHAERNSVGDYGLKEPSAYSAIGDPKPDQFQDKEYVNQDALGEMLEDLGVIVKRIGERAAARRQQCLQQQQNYAENQPLNLSELPNNDPSLVDCSGNDPPVQRPRSNCASQAIQLPSMAALASGNVSTPPSRESGTPGCISNAEPPATSPLLRITPSRTPNSVVQSRVHNQPDTPASENNVSVAENSNSNTGMPMGPSQNPPEQSNYNASGSNTYQRTAPMWSCESMCCPFTRDNEHKTPDMSTGSASNYSPDVNQVGIAETPSHFPNESNGETSQNYYPKDLSTRVMPYCGGQSSSSHDSPFPCTSPSSREATNYSDSRTELLANYPVHFSSKAAAMGSLMSAVEAVDHLRSLSALGAKYTASLGGMGEDTRNSNNNNANTANNNNAAYQQLRLSDYQYGHQQAGVHHQESPQTGSAGQCEPHNLSQIPMYDSFNPSNMPSALNSLLCREFYFVSLIFNCLF